MLDKKRIPFAVFCRAFGFLIVNLPVAARHMIFARIQRFAIEYANAPVEIGRHVLLRHDKIRFFEMAGERLVKLP